MLAAMLFPAPSMPEFPPDQSGKGEQYPRYEDCTQDGRLIPLAILPSYANVWQTSFGLHPGVRNARGVGVISLLTRLTVASLDQRIRVHRPLESYAGFQLAHDRDAAGEVSRLFLNVWADVHGRPYQPGTRGAPPDPAARGQRVLAGQAFSEHVFTRPFAPPDQRRVTSLAGIAGYPEIPETRYHQPPPASAGEAPNGATWLDELAPDTVETVFTLDQTDANQHVNSLVYIRRFLDAVQRRLAAGGHPANLRSKAFDIAYRKPSFVGDRVRAHVRLFAVDDQIGGAGFIAAAGEEAKPRCYVRVVFGP
jgi:hypothetical protein